MSNSPWIEATDDGVLLSVKVVPGGSRDAIVGPLGDALKIKVSAPPEGGKANRAVCRLLAEALHIPIADVDVRSGHGQPHKRISVRNIDGESVRRRLT